MSFHRLKKDVGEAVLHKYKHQCAECGSTKQLCVHHVERMKPHDKRYNDIDNLTVLCRACHMAYHRKAGHIVPAGADGNPYGRRGKDVPPIQCRMEGCERWQHAQRLCKRHYEYLRRQGQLGDM